MSNVEKLKKIETSIINLAEGAGVVAPIVKHQVVPVLVDLLKIIRDQEERLQNVETEKS